LEHLLRYCGRPPFALERLSVTRGPDGRIARVRYVLPRHKAANWVGPGRSRKSTRPDLAAQGAPVSRKTVVEVPLTGLSFPSDEDIRDGL